ncbi:MAG TPA: serine/threonine-protein kinase, partial [Deinococcales bacterium]|nr:serine/threonine-protein kinase [Deinococcales bacterium]
MKDRGPNLKRVEVISTSPFVTVERATMDGQDVLVKRAAPRLPPEAVERFEREGDIAERLDHPNIARLLARVPGLLVYEFVTAPTLEEALKAGAFTTVRAIAFARGLLSALAHAHGRGVIHLDLKPSNILLEPPPNLDRRSAPGAASASGERRDPTPGERRNPTLGDRRNPTLGDRREPGPADRRDPERRDRRDPHRGERVKLIDFGSAKDLTLIAITQLDARLGTPYYMAPEQFSGTRSDPRSDVYSLGAVLYEALMGRLPADDPFAWLTGRGQLT